MIKRVIVAGSRNYTNYAEAENYINCCISEIRKKYTLIFLSGGCRGADLLGEHYARANGFAIERYIANWQKFGKSAGPKRNIKMANNADFIICFWDGKSRGTKNLIKYCKKENKQIRIKIVTVNSCNNLPSTH